MPTKIQAADWSVVLTDTRGPYTTVIYEAAEGEEQASCLIGAATSEAIVTVGSGDERPAPVPAGQVSNTSFRMDRVPPGTEGSAYTQVSGRVGAGVTAVTLVLSDGTRVTSTISGGWFLAWWPGTQRTVAEEVTTSAGTSTQTIYDPLRH